MTHGLSDPARLDAATGMLMRWTAAAAGVTMVVGLMLHWRWVDVDDAAPAWFLAFGWTHVVLGLTLLAASRARLLRRAPRTHEAAFLVLGVMAPVIGGCLVATGTLLDLLVCRAILAAA